jgi:hypothetical protein
MAGGEDHIGKLASAGSDDQGSVATPPTTPDQPRDGAQSAPPVVFKVYKRRFIGLGQLILLNIVASWDVSLASSCLPRLRLSLTPGSGLPIQQYHLHLHNTLVSL